MGESTAQVSAVVLSWNRRDDTLACLRSLRAVEYAPLHVIVVDNGSADCSAEAVARDFPDVSLIRNERNLGYAEGMNVGIREALAASAELILLLNNDTEVDPAFLGDLVRNAQRADVAAVCPVIYFADGSDRIWYAGADYSPRRGYNGRQRGYGAPASSRPAATVETDRACGACVLVPARTFEQLGLFDGGLFAYAEDTEWSLRAREAGLRLLVSPKSAIWHKVSAASGGESSPDTIYYSVRNGLAVAERHAPLGPIGTWRRRVVLLAAHVAQVLLARDHLRRGLRAVAEGWHDFRIGRFGPRVSASRGGARARRG
jgi:GT2 family glycosyltransferase